MEYNELLEKIKNVPEDTTCNIVWKSNVKVSAKMKDKVTVQKCTTAKVKINVNYFKLPSVVESLKTTTEPTKPTWYTHLEDCHMIVKHKSDENKKYLQVFPIEGKGNSTTNYWVNGKETTPTELLNEGYCTKSMLPNSENTPIVFVIPIDNIQSIEIIK